MNYGLTPTTSAAAGTASQPSWNPLPESNTNTTTTQGTSTFTGRNRKRPAFIPRAHQHPKTPSDITGRKTTPLRQTPSTPMPYLWRRTSPEATGHIKKAFTELKNKHFREAEKAFRQILQHQDQLSRYDYEITFVGLARSLKEQTREKQMEACHVLESLRQNGSFTEFGASTIPNLDLTLSRCEQALGRHRKAEVRLLALRYMKPDAGEDSQCNPSGCYNIDLALARLWQEMGKHNQAERLLLNMKNEMEVSLKLAQRELKDIQAKLESIEAELEIQRELKDIQAELKIQRMLKEVQQLKSIKRPLDGDIETLRKSLDETDLVLARHWEVMGKHELAEEMLLYMSGKHPGTDRKSQCQPCDHHTLDLTLARLWQVMGKYELAENLLLNMSRKHPGAPRDKLCKPYGHHELDLTLARLWQVMGKYELAEKLLLNMSGKQSDDNENSLCTPCGRHELDLALARLWQVMGKYKPAEKLLLNMSGREDNLCTPCGRHELDLALALLWQVMGKYELAEKLLLNMCGKRPGARGDKLCNPCGHHELDLALARLWQVMGKYKLAEELLLNMSGRQSDDNENSLCTPCGRHELDLALALLWEVMGKHKLAEELLLNMSGKKPGANKGSLCKPCGRHELDLTLARHWQVMGKYKLAEKLLKRCCQLYRSAEFEAALLSLSVGREEFMEIAASYPESAGTLLTTSIHYFMLACEEIVKDSLKSGEDNLDKALESVETALEKYPPTAGAFSQKAHCLRMMGRSEQEWRYWFSRAASLDPSRVFKEKSDPWRKVEKAALEKMRGVPKGLE